MRLIPGKTKVQIELFKGVTLTDILVGLVGVLMIVFVLTSSLPGKLYIVIALAIVFIGLLMRLDTEPTYVYLLHILRHLGYKRQYKRASTEKSLVRRPDQAEDEAEPEESAPAETPEERKARLKAQREEYAADEKRLKSHKLTKEEEDAIWLKRAEQSAARKAERKTKKAVEAADIAEIISFTGIKDDLIEYGGAYYGAAIEIPPVEFRFFSEYRRDNSIENCLGRALRSIPADYAVNIVKLERPVLYDEYLTNEQGKIDELRSAYERGMITEEEFQARVEILFDRIYDLRDLCFENKVIEPAYYIVLFDSDKAQLNNTVSSTLDLLRNGEMKPHRLNDRELAVFLKYSYRLDFDERDAEYVDPAQYAAWAMPQSISLHPRTVVTDGIVSHNLRIVSYPAQVDDAWLATVMSLPATKVVVKCKPMDREKAVRGIDRSLQELRGQFLATGVDSKRMELQDHIDSLSSLLAMLQGDNENLLEVNVYVTAYDIAASRVTAGDKKDELKSQLATFNNMKRVVRRAYQEAGMKLNGMEFDQMNAFIGSQVSAYDPLGKYGRGMPTNSVAAAYPWVFAHITDKKGVKLGVSDGVPVFIDFFRRDSERVNSNMVIVGKSGSGKSYATKSLLTNLAADDSKIFILDPENEYTELAANLHGKFINVGNAQHGRLNPFHIITALDDDESDGGGQSGSYATHLQFLEEFFRQVLPELDKDAMEYLNALIDRMYTNMGITAETELSRLAPEDYPTFDDLYDAVLSEFQATDNEYIHTMLRTLMNYVAKFSSGGRNANIWNGPSTVTTEENFTVFNFQSLLANRNGAIANAQMLLVLKYIDNEIIKNRDYNLRHKMNRKVVVVIDEAHVFIDTKYPVALDFMFQLAKRIRKYNGMQIVITQNIKDFVGSEEIARKSTAIINACQYSFIFSLAPNDMDDLCKLYEKAGGINESEQEEIVSAPRGQAFTVMSPQSRSTFKVAVPEDVHDLFSNPAHESQYFKGEDGQAKWEEFLGDSRRLHDENDAGSAGLPEGKSEKAAKSRITFTEISEDEYTEEMNKRIDERETRRRTDDAPRSRRDDRDDRDDRQEDRRRYEPDERPDRIEAPAPTSREPAPTYAAAPDARGFDYEEMLREIRRSVREEVMRELGSRTAAEIAGMPAQTAQIVQTAQPAQPADRSENERTERTDYTEQKAAEDISVAGAGSVETSETTETTEASETTGSMTETDERQSIDIMSMLMQAAEDLGDISPLESMVEYDEMIVEITLEELMKYNAAHP